MDSGFTNLLLVTLITLIGFIGKVFYEKIESFSKKLESIIISDVSSNKDVEQLKKDVEDHERRITNLENLKK